MNVPRPPHRWSVSPGAAVAIQERLASRISTRPAKGAFRLVGGADVAFTDDQEYAVAAIVVWDVHTRAVVETKTARAPLKFPYVPGLLSFREGPALLAAVRRLRCAPDAFLFDGQGLAHPRRFGLASHMGLLIDRPSAGCGKSRLIGAHVEPGARRGARQPLIHEGETIGVVLRTRDAVKPVYVSVGHRISLDQAVDLTLACGNGYRLPEPTRLADQVVAGAKRRIRQSPAG